MLATARIISITGGAAAYTALNFTILEETENPFLADFYGDRPGAALQAQLFFLLNRHRQLSALRQADLFPQRTICWRDVSSITGLRSMRCNRRSPRIRTSSRRPTSTTTGACTAATRPASR